MNRSPGHSMGSNSNPEWQLIHEDGNIIWHGGQDSCPSIQLLSKLIGPDASVEVIASLSSQSVARSSVSNIPNLLNCLICSYSRGSDSTIDISMLQNILESSNKAVCGVVFKKGDIVWTCRQCAKDPTSVQCDKCFRLSDHQGHEVYFHRAGGDSGCCDCGDPEAWAKLGNCLHHSHVSNEHTGKNVDPLLTLPPLFIKGLRAVIKGVVAELASFASLTVRGFEKWDLNSFVQRPESADTVMVARLHNDDIHNVDQVTSALIAIGIPRQQANSLTNQVDKEGEAVVGQWLAGDPQLKKAYRALREDAGLLFSIVPKSIFEREARVVAAVNWMINMGTKNDGIRRVVSEELVEFIPDYIDSSGGSSSSNTVNNRSVFADPSQFPSVMSHLMDPLVPRIALSTPVYARSADERSQANESATDKESYALDFTNRLTRPFELCHHDALGILLLASPFMSKTVKKQAVELVVKFQHDAVFKAGFSQQMTMLYPALCVLHCRNIGTLDSTIFHTTVQVYTSNAVVALMSSDGTQGRLHSEGDRPIMITKMLMATFTTILRDVGCGVLEGSHRDDFLSHHSIHTHRISQVCRDMEYVTSDSFFCARILRGDVDFGVVGDILGICGLLQCIDGYRRMTDVHVEQETDRWQDAANLVLEFESISTHLVSAALFDPTSTKNDAISQFSYSKHAQAVEDISAIREHAVLICSTQAMQSVGEWCARHRTESLDGDMYFYSENGHDLCLGHAVLFSGIKRYQVSRSPVSVHLPLHRFLSKLIVYGAYGNNPLQDTMEMLCAGDLAGRVDFADYPLRCLSFSAQVACGMWRRNGATAANLAYNYSRAPLSKALHDMDLVAVQASVFTLSPDSLLALAIDRFELTPLLNNYQLFFSANSSAKSDTNKEFQAPLLNEFLRLLIHLVTNTPLSLVESTRDATRPTDGCAGALGREIVHHVLSGVTSAGQLQKVKTMIGTVSSVSDAMLMAAIDAVCVRKAADEGDAKVLSLRPESYLMYDPEYTTLNTQQASVAADRMRERYTANSAVDGVVVSASTKDLNQKFAPLINLQALPVPCVEFASLRCVLFRPLFFSLLHRSLRICIDNSESTTASSLSVVGRVIHLVTLQILCIDNPLQSAAHVSADNWNSGKDYFAEAFRETAENSGALDNLDACVERVRTSSGVQCSSDKKPTSLLAGAGRLMLAALAEVWIAGVVKDDILYHQGLGWILQQVVQHSGDGRDLLRSKGISCDSGAAAADVEDAAEKKRKRLQAQQRAILESQKRAAAFAAMAEDDSDEDDEDDEGEGEGGGERG